MDCVEGLECEFVRNGSDRAKKLRGQKVIAPPHDLTYNASIDSACIQAGLVKYELRLYPTQRVWRYIYSSSVFLEWNNPVLLGGISSSHDNDPISVQLASELLYFCSGGILSDRQEIRCLDPKANAVWELKTPDLRLFGWFPHKNYFILHHCEVKSLLMDYGAYQPHIEAVVQYRESLAHILPEYVEEKGVSNVISNRT